MKRSLSIIALIIAICTVFSAFVGCSLFEPAEKTFSKAGMSITLNDDFAENDIITQTAYYVSQDVIVTTLKEDGTEIADYTVGDYAELVCEVNNLSDTEITEKNGYAEFTYQKEASGKEFSYYARCFKNGTDFWLVQFICETKNLEKFTANFEKWAATVTFED